MMRCAASRWLIALRTWGALNEGFSGTCELLAAGTHASSRLVTHQYRSQFEQRVRELSPGQQLCVSNMLPPYSSELSIVTQTDGDSFSLLHAKLLQSPGKPIRVAIERIVRQAYMLMMRYHSVRVLAMRPCSLV